jgi:AcrR family transcriptional regulator
MPRVGLSPAGVVDAAVSLVDTDGPAALTLAAVAQHVGVATPSLYKHVRNLAELRLLVSARVMEEMTERLGAAVMGRAGDDAVRALMLAYRRYVLDHPHRYAMFDQTPNPDPVWSVPAERLTGVVLSVLREYGMEGAAAIHAARCLRSAAHGFASLEAAGGFGLPEKLDDSYDQLMQMLTHFFHNGLTTAD